MRLVTFTTQKGPRLGAVLDDQVIDLVEAATILLKTSSVPFPTTMLELLQGGEPAQDSAMTVLRLAREGTALALLARSGYIFPLDRISFLPPILRPGKIICLGHNYRHHIIEMGSPMPAYPVIFAKFANTLIGHQQPIVLPRVSTQVDYEAELMLVIGKTGKDIAPEDAFSYIAGYTLFNDVSVRDYQKRTVQWLQGKTFDGTGPVGPALVTADEISDPHALEITLRLNGETMQHSTTADFIFDIPTMISYLSQIMTLEPGDVIATGTPSGVGSARTPQVFLQPGDMVEVEITHLGVLQNLVVEAP